MICLAHIPKTGGTTFRNILINNFSWRHIDFPNEPKNDIRPSDFPLNSKLINHIQSLSGHRLRYSDEIQALFPEYKFVVFLREPISRIISLFFHIQRYEQPNLQFGQWVDENYATPLLSNTQTRFIAGEPDVDKAKGILTEKFFFAGSMEQFDHSLLLLQRMLGNAFDVRYVRKNTAKRHKKEILHDEKNKTALQRLHKHNEKDRELYEYVTGSLFFNYSKGYGEIAEQDLVQFRTENKEFRPSWFRVNIFRSVKYLFYENLFRLKG